MSLIQPFRALRPRPDEAARVAAVPYDVVNTDEARILATDNPLSFLRVSRAELELPPDSENCRHSWHLYGLRLNLDKLDMTRAQFIEELRQKNICASVHFIPIPLHLYYRTLKLRGVCRNTLMEYPRLVSLPLHAGLTDQDVQRVIEAVKSTLARHARSHRTAINQEIADAAMQTRA